MPMFSSLSRRNTAITRDNRVSRNRRNVLAAAMQQLEERVLLSSVSIADTSALEGSPLKFTVSLDAPSTTPISVNYSTANKTAKANHDYSQTKGTVNFAAGDTTETVTVNTLDNHMFTDPLTMRVKLSRATKGVKITGKQATGTINNVDAAPVLSVNNVSQQEGNRGKKNMKFTITETGTSKSPVSVNYATRDVSATAGSDYVAVSKTAKFHGKKTTFNVNVKIIGDTTPEADEAFLLQLSSPVNATLATPSYGVGSIMNDDGGAVASPVTISTEPAVTAGAGSSAGITVSLNEVSAVPVTMHYATADGTAIGGTDYTPVSGTLTFPVGITSQTVNVPILPGAAQGVFTMNLTTPAGATIAAGTTTVNISTSVPSLSISSVQVNQPTSGTATATFTVTLSAPATDAVTVSFATADGTAIAGTNYDATNGLLIFPAGTTTETIPVTILGGVSTSANFTVNLSAPSNATISQASATGTINNASAPLPTLSIDNVTQAEGTGANSTFDFTVSLTGASSSVVTVDYATADGTATVAGNDYLPTSGILTFNPGDSSTKTIQVTVIGDATVEPNENFTVNLTNPTGATLAVASGTGTIVNDDTSAPTTPAMTINDATAPANSGTENFVVSLSSAGTQAITVNYATADGTGANAAIAGTDYTATSGVLTFAAGQTSQTISVPLIQNSSTGPNKTFTLNLSSPANATLSNTSATGTIVNNNGVSFTQDNWSGSSFTYSLTSTRTDTLSGLELELFFTPSTQDLNTATPYRTFDLGPVAPGSTVPSTVDTSGQPTRTGTDIWQFRARVVGPDGTVYATDLGPLTGVPG